MKLSSARLQRTLEQFEAEPLPEDHPVMPQLNQTFGDHTFFLDDEGLSIVEPAGQAQSADTGKVVKLASWKDATQSSLRPHQPETTEVLITLGPDDSGQAG